MTSFHMRKDLINVCKKYPFETQLGFKWVFFFYQTPQEINEKYLNLGVENCYVNGSTRFKKRVRNGNG